MHFRNTTRSLSRLALCAGLLCAAAAAGAASPCKGLAQDTCTTTEGCLWVDGYTRKDGRAVTSHCKLKGGRKPATEASVDALRLSSAAGDR